MCLCACARAHMMGTRQFILFSQHESNFLLYIISNLIELIPCYIMSVAETGRQRQRDKGAKKMGEEGNVHCMGGGM